MVPKVVLALWLALMATGGAMAQEGEGEAKVVSGMSIVGNDEAPKALYIVPWKSSEMGLETSLHRMLDQNDAPVDRDVFMRQLDFYQVSTANTLSGR
ncbi:MAG: hypothetical protein IH614_15145 [Desulfuromonadales bacterium]|nr:hypothetical protein [Desulfuromonadales bacterium]